MLTETQIKGAKRREKPYKLFDERGLYVEVRPSGARWWRFRYHHAGKEKLLSLGTYPDVPLKRRRAQANLPSGSGSGSVNFAAAVPP